MPTINVWSKVSVAVQTAIAAAKTLTAITKASPAVASSTAHGYSNGDIVLLKISGMLQLDYAVVRVAGVTADTFQLEGVDSTNFDTFTAGTSEKLTLGASASTFQDINTSGGEAAPILVSTIHTDQDYELPGNRSPQVMSMGSLWDPADPALLRLKYYDELKTPCGVQFTFASGAKLFFAATPSASLAPTGSSGQPVTTPVSLRVRGRITAYTS